MKLLSSILLLNTIEAGWKQKWEERFGNAVEDKRATERNAACDAKALSETAKFEIQGLILQQDNLCIFNCLFYDFLIRVE